MGKASGESEASAFDSMPSKLSEKSPAIVLFKLDQKKEERGGPRWVLISWMPEASQVGEMKQQIKAQFQNPRYCLKDVVCMLLL